MWIFDSAQTYIAITLLKTKEVLGISLCDPLEPSGPFRLFASFERLRLL